MNEQIRQDTFNIASRLLDENAAERGDKVAIYCGEETVTYRDVLKNVNRFANVLKKLNVKPTERVMIHLPDSPMFIYAFLGSIKHGAWPVAVNTMLGMADYEYLLENSEARVLVTEKTSKAACAGTRHLCYRLFADDGLDEWLSEASDEAEAHPAHEDDIAFWLYSSGSTGRPKGTPHKHIDLLFIANAYGRNVLHITEEDKLFSVSKLFFAYGLGNSLAIPFRYGAPVVLLSDRPSPDNVLQIIQEQQPTIFFGVPTQYNSLLKKIDQIRFESIRLCASAGEALPPEVLRKWREKTGLTILDGIGSTEAMHIFISNLQDDVLEGTSGRLVPGFQAKIVDLSGKEVPQGVPGHLLIRGRSITPGYWKRPEENAEKMLEGGWFRTGDIYSQVGGYFTYQGRGDDMLKVGGIWVSPVEIENVLMEHKAVHECAVVGQEIEGLIKPFAYVILEPQYTGADTDKPRLSRELLDYAAGRLPRFKCPWDIMLPDELPKTATGKIQRFKLRMPERQAA
ncbi:benzoate-CoA ligase family protein [Desulfatiglans anilini]|uniref:benzoate-CoA ligase family protein n=1 Tax=Desulfatiglans anilini TaxID=90728 RepID=UPI000407303C|nr:benzoate-CoA ligase family protein [Desulfatiglans anilini]